MARSTNSRSVRLRRRFRCGALAGLALLLWFGLGSGWIGPPVAEAEAENDDEASAPPVLPGPRPDDRAPETTSATGVASPLGESAPPAAEGEADASPGIDPDRFSVLFSAVVDELSGRRFGEARLALDLLLALPLASEQRRRADALEAEFDAALRGLTEELVRAIRAGHAVRARQSLRRAEEGGEASRNALREALVGLGLPVELERAPLGSPERWPVPRPLAKDRLVAADRGERHFVGRVVDCRPDRVTLRVTVPRGQLFPTVPLVACEPVDVRGDEAVELGFAALHRGDLVLARLWLACALCRTVTVGDRLDRLRAALP